VHDMEDHREYRAFSLAVREDRAAGATMYFLSKDCYVCNTQGYWIILNVSRDKYLCVTNADLTSIGSWMHGWQRSDDGLENPQHLDVARDSLIRSLLANGVLTIHSEDGKAFVESEHVASKAAAACAKPILSTKATVSYAAHFLFACAKMDWCLRKGKLALTLARIERRRRRAGPCTSALECSNATKLIAVFKDLRPLYPRRYLCLFDSLALLEFLAGYHSYPRIVFGVVADPFQAHCWLQEGDMLLNDDLERISRYKRIMSV
jgi:hypothetical protein